MIVLCYSSHCLSKICSKRLFLPLNYHQIYHWVKEERVPGECSCLCSDDMVETWATNWILQNFPISAMLAVHFTWIRYIRKQSTDYKFRHHFHSELVGCITTFSGSFCTQDMRREREGNRTDMISSKVEYNLVGNLATPGMKTYLAAV